LRKDTVRFVEENVESACSSMFRHGIASFPEEKYLSNAIKQYTVVA